MAHSPWIDGYGPQYSVTIHCADCRNCAKADSGATHSGLWVDQDRLGAGYRQRTMEFWLPLKCTKCGNDTAALILNQGCCYLEGVGVVVTVEDRTKRPPKVRTRGTHK